MTAVVLCGGRGVRMGLVEKGLQPFRGAPLVAAVLARLRPQVGAVLISANRHLDAYAMFASVVTDRIADHPGPLAGIDAALAACAADLLVAAPCDAPFLPLDLVARLAGPFEDPAVDLTYARTTVRSHPVFCMVRRAMAAGLADRLARGERRVEAWVVACDGVAVSFDDEAPFRNLNTYEELRDAEGATTPLR